MEVRGLAGDREVAHEALLDEPVSPAVGLLLRFLVGDDAQAHAHLILGAKIGQRQQQAGERPLHVVGTAAVEAIAVDARHELLLAAGHNVDVAVEEHHRTAVTRANLGHGHRQPPHPQLLGGDVASVEPALDETSAQLDALNRRSVVLDQLLR